MLENGENIMGAHETNRTDHADRGGDSVLDAHEPHSELSDSAILKKVAEHEFRMHRDVLEDVLRSMGVDWNELLEVDLAENIEKTRKAIVAHVIRIVSSEAWDMPGRAARIKNLFTMEVARRRQEVPLLRQTRSSAGMVFDAKSMNSNFPLESADKVA